MSTGAGSPDPRGAQRVLASLVAAIDLTPAPTKIVEEGHPWEWAIAAGPFCLAQRGTLPSVKCPDITESVSFGNVLCAGCARG